jgi:nickel/cobalt transporter (NicO) family protein
VTFVVSGLASGALHAVSAPDHVVGLAPLALERRTGAWHVGLLWGAGHALGSAAIGVVLVAALSAANLSVAEAWGERAAGIALAALGLAGLVRRTHAHAHAGAAAGETRPGAVMLVGLVHGGTGAAGLLLLLPGALAGSGAERIGYLAGFAAGSTVAMAGLTAALAALSRAMGVGRVAARLARVASGISIPIGVWWALAA